MISEKREARRTKKKTKKDIVDDETEGLLSLFLVGKMVSQMQMA